LNKPGGNITGATMLSDELGSKRVELLHELVPGATLIGALLNPTGAGAPRSTRDLLAAANTFGLRVEIVKVSSDREFESAFAEFLKLRVGALLIVGDPLFNGRSEQLAELTARQLA
jgi:putative ABC transport system substrate-binding protein